MYTNGICYNYVMNYMPPLPYLRKYLKTLSREYKLIEHKLKVKVKKNIRCRCKMYKQDVR